MSLKYEPSSEPVSPLGFRSGVSPEDSGYVVWSFHLRQYRAFLGVGVEGSMFGVGVWGERDLVHVGDARLPLD